MTHSRLEPGIINLDRLEVRYPRPPFRQMAAAGIVSPTVALFHMAIYDSLGKTPPIIDFIDVSGHRWGLLWRMSIDLARQWWEERRDDFEVLRHEYRDKLNAFASPGQDWSFVRREGEPPTWVRMLEIFPFPRQAYVRVWFFEDLGWPYNRLLKDTDAFAVEEMTRLGVFRIGELSRSGRLRPIGDVGDYATRADAERDFVRVVTSFLEERAHKQLKAAAAKRARATSRIVKKSILSGDMHIGHDSPRG